MFHSVSMNRRSASAEPGGVRDWRCAAASQPAANTSNASARLGSTRSAISSAPRGLRRSAAASNRCCLPAPIQVVQRERTDNRVGTVEMFKPSIAVQIQFAHVAAAAERLQPRLVCARMSSEPSSASTRTCGYARQDGSSQTSLATAELDNPPEHRSSPEAATSGAPPSAPPDPAPRPPRAPDTVPSRPRSSS